MANTSKVSRMSDFNNNVLFVSPEQAIADLQEHLQNDPDYDKVFLIAVNTKDGQFDYSWWKGKISTSDSVAVLTLCLNDMVEALK